MLCLNCLNSTSNPKFCSRKCSASYNNKFYPKKKITRICKELKCSNLVANYKTTFCITHIPESASMLDRTIESFLSLKSIKNKHPSWRYAHIRSHNRSYNKHLLSLPCNNCGYTKHVELCHIKAISTFPLSAMLKEVNNPVNIVQLCRNCHWEFDNGLLSVEL